MTKPVNEKQPLKEEINIFLTDKGHNMLPPLNEI